MTIIHNKGLRTLPLLLTIVAWTFTGLGAEITNQFAKWEPEIKAFEAKDKLNPPSRGGILFIGSSSIRMWTNLAPDFPEHRVLNRGFGGSQIEDSTHFAERIVFPYAPKQIILYAGGNDLNAKKTPERVFADFTAFVAKVHSKLPETRIAYISIAPNPARWAQLEQIKAANGMIEEFTHQDPKLAFINVFPLMLGEDGLPKPDIYRDDKLHMNPKGYAIWKKVVGEFLKKEMQR